MPSLNSLWRHGCDSELLGFLLSTNDTVKQDGIRQCQPSCWKSYSYIYICYKIILIFTELIWMVKKTLKVSLVPIYNAVCMPPLFAKIPVSSIGKFPSLLLPLGKFASPLNRCFTTNISCTNLYMTSNVY
jgi:hypothetical protein